MAVHVITILSSIMLRHICLEVLDGHMRKCKSRYRFENVKAVRIGLLIFSTLFKPQ